MANNRLTRKQRAAVVRRQKITLAAGIAVLILVIIFVLAFKGCNSKKKNNDKTVPANTETTTDDNKTTTENNSENIKSEEDQDASTSSDNNADNNSNGGSDNNSGNDNNSSDYSGSQYADSQSVSSKGFSIQTINGITYVDGVLIANKTYSLPSDFIPQDPEVPVTSQRSTTSLDRTLMSAWRTMQADASSQGLNIYIASAYRSYSYQVNLYNSYVARVSCSIWYGIGTPGFINSENVSTTSPSFTLTAPISMILLCFLESPVVSISNTTYSESRL